MAWRLHCCWNGVLHIVLRLSRNRVFCCGGSKTFWNIVFLLYWVDFQWLWDLFIFCWEGESFVSGDFMHRSQRQTGQEETRPAAAIEPQNVAAWIHKWVRFSPCLLVRTGESHENMVSSYFTSKSRVKKVLMVLKRFKFPYINIFHILHFNIPYIYISQNSHNSPCKLHVSKVALYQPPLFMRMCSPEKVSLTLSHGFYVLL